LFIVNGNDLLLMVNRDDVFWMVNQNWGIDDGKPRWCIIDG
jgi:hypothetical protein